MDEVFLIVQSDSYNTPNKAWKPIACFVNAKTAQEVSRCMNMVNPEEFCHWVIPVGLADYEALVDEAN